jgi:hypothetical protein
MDYIIGESQLDDLIKKQLDNMFDVSNINWTNPIDIDDDTDEEFEDPNRILFYFGDYGDEDTVFRWYGKEYWGGTESESYNGYKSKSPIVEIDEPYLTNLNGLFGNIWYKPFKEWFKENFEVSVKTVMDEIHN